MAPRRLIMCTSRHRWSADTWRRTSSLPAALPAPDNVANSGGGLVAFTILFRGLHRFQSTRAQPLRSRWVVIDRFPYAIIQRRL
jgi:hypothetical protein